MNKNFNYYESLYSNNFDIADVVVTSINSMHQYYIKPSFYEKLNCKSTTEKKMIIALYLLDVVCSGDWRGENLTYQLECANYMMQQQNCSLNSDVSSILSNLV